MECTQRLECTQDTFNVYSERICPEQIGFLGICGSKQPVKKGPNKIGRDPQTCAIVLDDNSISRQHAVINILNKKEFMLMDLDSSNKTKLLGKTLQPYIPHPLRNGDTVQFGQLFGIFRLLEEDDDLPMTQALEIPETPINIKYTSRLKIAPITTVPESPDVSDRDDSIIPQSQPMKESCFKSPNNNFIKTPGNILGINCVDSNTIDNVYWISSKKSESFSSKFDGYKNSTVNKSSVSPNKFTVETSIYDMETQAPQLPDIDQTSDSIHEANTQVPCVSPTIYSCETQVPNVEKLPEVCKVKKQSNVELNLYSINEKFNLYEAETQVMLQDKGGPAPSNIIVTDHKKSDVSCINKKLNSSDEEICFDEIDCQQLEDDCGSQPLLPPDHTDLCFEKLNSEKKIIDKNEIANNAILSGIDLKDCDEIAPSQVIPEKPPDDEDVTDCEDNILELPVDNADKSNKNQSDDDVTDCEDDVIEISQNREKISNLEDLPTQVIAQENLDEETKYDSRKDDVPFEDMLTQVIEECPLENCVIAHEVNNINKSIPFTKVQSQVIDMAIPQEQSGSTPNQMKNTSHFKKPISSPKPSKKELMQSKTSNRTRSVSETKLQRQLQDNENYYDATQHILDDLCTQSESFRNTIITEKSCKVNNSNKKNTSFVSNISNDPMGEVIGADTYVTSLSKKKSSDSSDLEVTPKKFNTSKFLMIDLPNTQEIKGCDFVSSKLNDTDSSDGFDDTEDRDVNEHSPEKNLKRMRKKDIKLDLMKKFDVNTLPTRAITRIRKPTSKLLDSDSSTKKIAEKILQSKLGLDKEHEIDEDVIQLNLKRLRSKMEKAKNKKSDKDVILKPISVEQSIRRSRKNKSKKRVQTNEKELKQQSIKSMVKEPTSNNIMAVEACKNVKTDSMDSHHGSRRSSRHKNKRENRELMELGVKEIKSDKKTSGQAHSKRKQVKEDRETIDLTHDEETVIRRSRRHQIKDKNDDKKEKIGRSKEKLKVTQKSEKIHTDTTKNINTNTQKTEHSAIYNLSSETAMNSPQVFKRQATSDIIHPKTKKAKSNSVISSVRATPSRGIRTQYVLFTAFPCEEVKHKLEKLGAVITADVKTCTVVLTLQIKRTFKLLCAVGLGKPIVGPNWVQACADSNMIVDPWLYLMKDEVSEKRFGFNLRQSLTCKRNYLKGYNIFCTPNVTPSAEEMKSIVECSGGTWKEGGRSWFCLTSPADKALWPGLRRRGATLVSTEFILGGVLQQRINLERDKLG